MTKMKPKLFESLQGQSKQLLEQRQAYEQLKQRIEHPFLKRHLQGGQAIPTSCCSSITTKSFPKLRVRFEPKSAKISFFFSGDPFSNSNLAVCAKFRPLASHGMPWQHSKILRRCDTQRHYRNENQQR